jgi:hypothetical protein
MTWVAGLAPSRRGVCPRDGERLRARTGIEGLMLVFGPSKDTSAHRATSRAGLH